MMERATLPLESAVQLLDQTDAADPLADLRAFMLGVIRITVEDPQARRVFEIASDNPKTALVNPEDLLERMRGLE